MTPVSSQSDKHCPSYELQSDHNFWGSYHNREPLRPENSEHLPGTILTGTSFNWRLIIPTKLALLHTGFGQPSLAHSFHQEECFETILLEIIKSGHSNPCDTLDLLLSYPLHAHLALAVMHLSDYAQPPHAPTNFGKGCNYCCGTGHLYALINEVFMGTHF